MGEVSDTQPSRPGEIRIDGSGAIDLDYRFHESLNTHVIDSLNGKPHWWYQAFYDGGWSESNNYRMDHFPYKDGSTIRVGAVSQGAHGNHIHIPSDLRIINSPEYVEFFWICL